MSEELTVVCAAYRRYRRIHVLVHSFLCQTLDNWKLRILHDGPDERMPAELAPYVEGPAPVELCCTERRFDDYGHSLRERGLREADTEFVMFTNDDNYYAPKFLEYMFGAIRADDLDFVLCNMIHSHENPGEYKQDDYHVFDSYPRLNYVDVGNFIVRRRCALQVGFEDKSFGADGIFVERLMDAFNVRSFIPDWPAEPRAARPGHETLRVGKVDRVLFVHN